MRGPLRSTHNEEPGKKFIRQASPRTAARPKFVAFEVKFDVFISNAGAIAFSSASVPRRLQSNRGFAFILATRLGGVFAMLGQALLGVHLIIFISAGPMADDPTRVPSRPASEAASVQKLINSATECVAKAVAEKSGGAPDADHLSELIVSVMPDCVDRMRAMIDSLDRNFGEGSGEAFFSGSYLDLLPRAVTRQIAK
jgi:hypothetical protein